ncbi:MAG: AAA family ATPase [Candidatus Brocadiae bacterium]|nr:AAA family ATPase [Candidatus Brocadiia bacterium]
MTPDIFQEKIHWFQKKFKEIQSAMGQILIGQEEVLMQTLIAFFANGHLLLEGLPGLGKTLLSQSLGQILGISYKRIQFTPDLMPADILGTNVLWKDEKGMPIFRYEEGPIFCDLLLADEINRATPKTQSALLQAMQERKVTISGKTHDLSENFMVMATQNPIEMEGTYPLPEAQLDRFFFKVQISLPGLQELIQIAQKTTQDSVYIPEQKFQKQEIMEMKSLVRQVCIHDILMESCANLILNTHAQSPKADPLVKKYVQYGASPRGLQAIVLGAKVRALFQGRSYVAREDILFVLQPALRHRILLNFQGEAEGINSLKIIEHIQNSLKG